jgi:hypothetical protein
MSMKVEGTWASLTFSRITKSLSNTESRKHQSTQKVAMVTFLHFTLTRVNNFRYNVKVFTNGGASCCGRQTGSH